MIFLNIDIQSKSSIEETDDLSSDVSFSAFLVGEDALVGREDEVAELPGGEDVIGPLFKVRQQDIVPGRDDCALVDAADEFDHDLLASVVVDDLELSDVVVPLHDAQEFEQDFGDWLEEDLLFAFPFGVHNASQCVSEDVYFHHFCGANYIK